jgi:hypothetical protein
MITEKRLITIEQERMSSNAFLKEYWDYFDKVAGVVGPYNEASTPWNEGGGIVSLSDGYIFDEYHKLTGDRWAFRTPTTEYIPLIIFNRPPNSKWYLVFSGSILHRRFSQLESDSLIDTTYFSPPALYDLWIETEDEVCHIPLKNFLTNGKWPPGVLYLPYG